MPLLPTRGQRHLREYLEDGNSAASARTGPARHSGLPDSVKRQVRAKTAKDVVPVLKEREATTTLRATPKGATDGDAIAVRVITYLQARAQDGATNKISPSQMKLVAALSSTEDSREGETATEGKAAPFRVKRSVAKNIKAIVDTIALAALQRRAGSAEDLMNSSLFVLAENDAAAKALQTDLEQRYGLTVLLLADDADRHPAFPLTPKRARGRSPTPPPQAATTKGKKGSKKQTQRLTAEADVAAAVEDEEEPMTCAVVVATPHGFLAVDKRSAVWKFIGAYVLALTCEGRQSRQSGLLSLMASAGSKASAVSKGKTKEGFSDAPVAFRLAEHRWACLSHTTASVVLAVDEKVLTAAALDWLLTLRPHESSAAALAVESADAQAMVKPQQRRPTTVYYAVAEGIHRFGFLYSLVKSLTPGRGLVVHFATKEACAFMYNVLYSFLNELPAHLQLLTDYEGEGEFSASASTIEDRYNLCQRFNKIIKNDAHLAKPKAAILLSCFGLVPSRGHIFVAYDVLPDVVNFNQFVADVLTPAAYLGEGTTPVNGNGGEENGTGPGKTLAQRDVTVRKRGRSVSPQPLAVKAAKKNTSHTASHHQDDEASQPTVHPALYSTIIVLLRPNEVTGALRHLKHNQSRFQLTHTPLPQKPSLSTYLLAAEALKEMHKKVFTIANAAYQAYRATMIVYCTVGPRDVYNEKEVNLEKVSEEFGHTELPLLDLRLRDTAFRPKEDFYKAAKVKQLAERRAYKKFVDANIVGEGPEEHVVE